jgi:hypothetical protein
MLRYTSRLFELLNRGGGLSCSFTQLLQYSHTAINQHSFPVQFSGLPSKLFVHTLTQHFCLAHPTFVMHTGDVGCLLLTTWGDFSFKPLCWKLETTLAACSVVVKSSFLNSPFTRLWMLLFWRSLQHRLVSPHCQRWARLLSAWDAHCSFVLLLAHSTTCLPTLAVMPTTTTGMNRASMYGSNIPPSKVPNFGK